MNIWREAERSKQHDGQPRHISPCLTGVIGKDWKSRISGQARRDLAFSGLLPTDQNLPRNAAILLRVREVGRSKIFRSIGEIKTALETGRILG